MINIDFVFVHSYSSAAPNWEEVMIGNRDCLGRIARAIRIAEDFGLHIFANDAEDQMNAALYSRSGIANLCTAHDTCDEVASAIAHSRSGGVIFVSSPDHLPRVVRDVMARGATRALFAASDVPFSAPGPGGVEVIEPCHKKL